MNTIFEFTDRTSVYSKCIFASICHAVMVGKYTLLSDEISWDGTSFLFQNMEGTRGVISFSEKNFLCGIQSEENYLEGENNIENTLLKDAELEKPEVIAICVIFCSEYFKSPNAVFTLSCIT